jgi:hypothetical protein
MLMAMLAVNALVVGTLLLAAACALRCRLGQRHEQPARVRTQERWRA